MQDQATPSTASNVPGSSEEPQPIQKKSPDKFLVSLLIVLFLTASGLAGYFAYQNYQLKKQLLEIQPTSTSDTPDKTATPTPLQSDRETSQAVDSFPYVSESLLKTEKNVSVTPSDKFVLVSSLLSPDGSKLAFSEVSSCFNSEYVDCFNKVNYDNSLECPECNEVYKLFYKDLATNKKHLLYEHPSDNDAGSYGKAQYVHFPYTWTPDSNSLITQHGILWTAPTEGLPAEYFQINLENKKIDKLGNKTEIVFNPDYSKVAVIEASENFRWYCMATEKQYGESISVKNLLTGESSKLLEGDGIFKLVDFTDSKLKYKYISYDEANKLRSETDICPIKDEYLQESAIDIITNW